MKLKKLTSLLLALAMILSLLPAITLTVQAATGYDRGYAGGMAGSGEYKAFGLDVSSWQGAGLDFNRIKNAGYSYVILRAGTSKGKDSCFDTYYANAKAAGLDVGAYYYSYATSVAAVQADMRDFISYLAGKTYEYPIYFDYEDSTQQALSASLSQEICLTAMDMLAAEGYLVGMYTGKYFSTKLPMDVICARYEVWIAHYLASGDGSYNGTGDYWKYGPTYASQYGMYQFTDSVWIDGYGPYDGDVCYKDYPSIVKTYGFNGYNSGKNPVGYIDEVTVEGPGKVRVRGWTLDEDELGTSLEVHVYIGGTAGDPNAEGHKIVADQPREDIAAAYPWAGNAHGFDVVLSTGKSGWQVINAYGISVGGGDNTLLSGSGNIADIPLDTEKPVITDVQVTNVTATGYTVTCSVFDNVGISRITMPTWTEAGQQDDIVWGEPDCFIYLASYNVSFSSHNFEYGTYNTHIYVYDLAGNMESYPLVVEVPPVLSEAPISGTVPDNTYFIANALNQNYVLDVSNASVDNQANVQLWWTMGNNKQHMWKISDSDGDGYYTIICVNSDKALEAAGGGTTNGTNVQQYEYNGTDAQLWKLEDNGDGTYRIVNKNSGLSLDLDCGVLNNGQNIQLYAANDASAQKWRLIPADLTGPAITNVAFSEITSEGFRVTCDVSDMAGVQKLEFPTWTEHNDNDDLVWHQATIDGNTATCYVSIADHNLEPGDYNVHIYAYDNLGNLAAIVTEGVTIPNRIGKAPVTGALKDGTYFVTSAQNQNFAMEVAGASMDNAANVQLWETIGLNTNHIWQIADPDGDGYYTLKALHSGKYLDVDGGVAASGTNVQQFEDTNSPAQQWQIVPNDDGTYSIYSMCGGYALDLFYGWTVNGSNISIHDVNGSDAQKWCIIPASLPADADHIHTYLTAEVTAPTCTEVGGTTHTCANCGYSYVTDEVAALGHSFENGTCTVCGAADPDYVNPVVAPTVAMQYPSLSFEDVIIMNVYYTAENIQNVEEMGLITYTSKPAAADVATADQVIPGYAWSESDGMYYSSTAGIAPKDLGDNIYFGVYWKLSDGSYGYSKVVGYSPKSYAMNMLKTGTVEMKTLAAAMLNYGAAAQTYFGYKTDALVNADMAADQKALVAAYSDSMIATVTQAPGTKLGFFINDKTYSKRYPTISFEGAFCINYYFQPTLAVEGDVMMYLWSLEDYNAATVLTKDNATKAVKMELTESGEYLAVVDGIAAKDLDKAAYVTFVYSDGTTEHCGGVLGYTIGMYCKSQASGTNALAALAKACAVYGYYAKQLFN